jgi:cobalt-zinc-cadmium efflux system outer membrane protein
MCLLAGMPLADPASGQLPEPRDTLYLSLPAAQQLAVRSNPELLAALWRPEAVRGDIRSAELLRFNPDAAFESRSPSDGFASRFEAEVGMDFEIGGQRGLRISASEASLDTALGALEDHTRRLIADVSRAYSTLLAAEERFSLASESNRLSGRLLEIVQTQLEEGEVSVLESNTVSIEAARAEARAIQASSSRRTASLRLGRLLGADPSTFIATGGADRSPGLEEAPQTVDEVVQRAMALRPDLKAIYYAVDQATFEEQLARRESLPNVRVAALATREDPLADPRFGFKVGIGLPFFNRNQGETLRNQAEIVELENLKRAAENRIRTEVHDAWRTLESAKREVGVLEVSLTSSIRANQGLLETAYREGELDLTSLLLLRNQLLEAEFDYWDAWERRELAHTDLRTATGEILQDIPPADGSAS